MSNREKSPVNGILIIDKPEDFTSFDVCAKLRRIVGQRRIGHTGTLDPMATGVMVVLLGTATRAAELMPVHDKRYIAGFRLGMTTDTLDITGTVTTQRTSDVSTEALESALGKFRGEIDQLPPMYSAVHSDGRRLYELAREGKEVERTPRRIKIHRLELLGYDSVSAEGTLDVECSRGTYIRSLIDDIGSQLGCGGVMTSLRRTEACGFTLDEAITIAQAQELGESGQLSQRIMPVEKAFEALDFCGITDKQSVRYLNGGELDLSRMKHPDNAVDGQHVRVIGPEGFLGIGRIDRQTEQLRPYKKF